MASKPKPLTANGKRAGNVTKGHGYVARVSKEKARIAKDLLKGGLVVVRKEHKAEYHAAKIAIKDGIAVRLEETDSTLYIQIVKRKPKPLSRLHGMPQYAR